jgi:hypothetical protein
MPKRTIEQALRDEWNAADKAVKEAKSRFEAAKAAANEASTRRSLASVNLEAAKARRKKATDMLEIHLGSKIEEAANGESAAPAATGADAEVQPDGDAT